MASLTSVLHPAAPAFRSGDEEVGELKALAAVQTGDRRIEMMTVPVPDDVGEDEALLEIEGNGMCGSDWDQYLGMIGQAARYPVIDGHETVGRIAHVGARAAERMGVKEGDRVALESTRPCGACPPCLSGRWLYCDNRLIYGLTSLHDAPGLNGGYAEYLWMRSNSRVYRLPDHLSVEDAVFFNPLGSGFDWAVRIAGTRLGDTVLIMGPGQRGLACVIAAREAGAGRIIVGGRGLRPWKLDLALRLGATHVVNTDRESVVEFVREVTGGSMVDRAIDTTPHVVRPVEDCIDSLRSEGTLVLTANKEEAVPNFVGRMIGKALTVRGAYSVSEWAKIQAVRVLSTGRLDLSGVHTHTLPITELDRAMRILGGEVAGEEPLHITVTPR
jgi:threonine dehydrogenase-like Zn-dependent dehydrogenase